MKKTGANRLLNVHDLCIEGYQEEEWRQIVNGVSFYVDRGEVLGLIGESVQKVDNWHCVHGIHKSWM